MSAWTKFLNLLKKDPVVDGNDTFNVQTMLNENWDKIDGAIGDVATPAQKMGLTGELSIGKALGVLADVGNVHVWRRTTITGSPSYSLSGIHEQSTVNVGHINSPSNNIVGDSVVVNDDLSISINSPTTVAIKSIEEAQSTLIGKFWAESTTANIIYFFPPTATFTRPGGQNYVKATGYQTVVAIPAGTHTTFHTSTNPNAYTEGTVGDTTIEYLGSLGDKARIEMGSYVGTGTYGSSNPNSLTFDFAPKLVIIERDYSAPRISVFIRGVTFTSYSSSSSSDNKIELTWTDKTISWSAASTDAQLNLTPIESGSYKGKGKYFFIAIG